MEVVIREFSPGDEDALQLVAKQALATLRKHYVPGPFAKKIGSESPFTRLVAICENRIVGTVIFEEEEDALYFGSVGVLDEYRRKGILSALVNHLKIFCKIGFYRRRRDKKMDLAFSILYLLEEFRQGHGRPLHPAAQTPVRSKYF